MDLFDLTFTAQI